MRAESVHCRTDTVTNWTGVARGLGVLGLHVLEHGSPVTTGVGTLRASKHAVSLAGDFGPDSVRRIWAGGNEFISEKNCTHLAQWKLLSSVETYVIHRMLVFHVLLQIARR